MKKLLIACCCCWLAAMGLNYIHKILFPLKMYDDIRFVPAKESVSILSCGHQGLAADVLFIQVVLHSGSLMWKPLHYAFDSEWSYQMMDLVTRIDPKYYSAYLFSGMGLIHNFSDARRARPILERGMEHFPDSWELPFWIGYGAYVYQEDYETAGKYFWLASRRPNAPSSFLSLMLSSLKKSDQYERAIWALERLIEQSRDPKTIQVYNKRIQRLSNLIKLQEGVEKYRTAMDKPLKNLNELIGAGLLDNIPEDPMKGHYVYDPEKNRVVVIRDLEHQAEKNP